jgi:dsRNA-specific ribonuclease
MKVSPNLGNPKGELQEFMHAETNEAPSYIEISKTGPDHDRSYICAVVHTGVELARGAGKNKKDAEANAATAAVSKLKARTVKVPKKPKTPDAPEAPASEEKPAAA